MNKLMKRAVVFSQLEKEIIKIFKEEHDEYLFYKRECGSSEASPERFISELIDVAKIQQNDNLFISKIQKYYECDDIYAILLYKFTDAYFLIN